MSKYTIFECPKCGRRETALARDLSCIGRPFERNGVLVGGHDGVWMKRVETTDKLKVPRAPVA